MQARNRAKVSQITLETLMNHVSDPRRLGGHTRAIGIINRTPYGEAWKAFFQRDLRTFRDLQDFFSSMLEEEAARVLVLLGARMPDLTENTVVTTVNLFAKAA